MPEAGAALGAGGPAAGGLVGEGVGEEVQDAELLRSEDGALAVVGQAHHEHRAAVVVAKPAQRDLDGVRDVW